MHSPALLARALFATILALGIACAEPAPEVRPPSSFTLPPPDPEPPAPPPPEPPAAPLAATEARARAPHEVAMRTARMLAGVAAEDAEPFVRAHAESVRGHRAAYERTVGEAMSAWAAKEVPAAPGDTVLYPFSGPDFVTVHRLYPRAGRYVLVSREEAGALPDVAQMTAHQRRGFLHGTERMLESFLRRGFFLTRAMGRDFPRGVVATLALFAVMEGFVVEDVIPMRVSVTGELTAEPGAFASVRLSLRRSDGSPADLDFVSMDLSDGALRNDAPKLRFLESVAQGRALVKAASHLMQQHGFSAVRDVLLDGPLSLVEDETGVAYDPLSARYDVTLYGDFRTVNGLFDGRPQRGLRDAYARGTAQPLPFPIGYRKAAGSCLLVATRTGRASPRPGMREGSGDGPPAR